MAKPPECFLGVFYFFPSPGENCGGSSGQVRLGVATLHYPDLPIFIPREKLLALSSGLEVTKLSASPIPKTELNPLEGRIRERKPGLRCMSPLLLTLLQKESPWIILFSRAFPRSGPPKEVPNIFEEVSVGFTSSDFAKSLTAYGKVFPAPYRGAVKSALPRLRAHLGRARLTPTFFFSFLQGNRICTCLMRSRRALR